MKKPIILIYCCIVVSVFFFEKLNAQDKGLGKFFITGSSGVYFFSRDLQKQAYGSQALFQYGGSVGFPVGRVTYIYIQLMYFETNGINFEKITSFDTGGRVIEMSTEANGTSDFQMRRSNIGFQRSFLLSKYFSLQLKGGITLIKSKNLIERENEEPFYDNRDGWLGFFGGIGVEKKIRGSAFALIFDNQYNTTNDNFIVYIGDFGGYSYSFGLRYYLPQSKKIFG